MPRHPLDGSSQVSGSREQPLIELTIPQQFAATVEKHSTQEALVFRSRNVRWTWAELGARVDALAAGFASLSLRPGDRVGVLGPNSPEWLLTQFATARLGLILVTINPAYRAAELEYALSAVQCRALVTATRFRTSNYIEMLLSLAPELAQNKRGLRLPHLEHVIAMDPHGPPWLTTVYELMQRGQAVSPAGLDQITSILRPEDPINIQFTSGTTGAPKGATLTHRNIVNNAFFVVSGLSLTSRDRLCIPVPLYHCFGMVMGSLGCATVGAQMVFPCGWFDPSETLAGISLEQCTAVYGVPSMFAQMLDRPELDTYSFDHLRTGIMAGAPCPVELMKRAIDKMNLREISICYGMTETSPVSFQTAIDDPIDRKVSTIGRVHPHVDVKIAGGDGIPVPIGETGEICCRGYSVMRGYWGDVARTREAIVDGWMHTGDLGTLDAEGYARVVGRGKDMVIRCGENIYPREIEELLATHPKVREAQVFGVPDDKNGEELCAWVVCKAGASATQHEISEFCRDRISHFKVPTHIRFKNELPLMATGKPQKFKMREEMIAELASLQ